MSTWVLHYKEQCRLYDKVSAEAYTEGQKVQFLNMEVARTPDLCNILNLHNVAKRAAGDTNAISWDVYVGLLMEQAEVHDAANTST